MRLLEGKTAIVTGATGGIGLQTAIGLVKLGATVVVTGRDQTRGQNAVTRIREQAGSEQVELALGDLSTASGVEALAADLTRRFPSVDILINNAGRMAPVLAKNEDDFESNFAMNVVAPLLLSRGLLPALRSSPAARIVNLTGGDGGKLDISDLQCEQGFSGLNSYSHSKRILEAMSLALAREFEPFGITVNIVYPGQASTSMTQSVDAAHLPWWMRPVYPLFKFMVRPDGGKSARRASRSSIWAASDASLKGKSGLYFDKNCQPADLDATVRSLDHQKRVLETIARGLKHRALT